MSRDLEKSGTVVEICKLYYHWIHVITHDVYHITELHLLFIVVLVVLLLILQMSHNRRNYGFVCRALSLSLSLFILSPIFLPVPSFIDHKSSTIWRTFLLQTSVNWARSSWNFFLWFLKTWCSCCSVGRDRLCHTCILLLIWAKFGGYWSICWRVVVLVMIIRSCSQTLQQLKILLLLLLQ